VTTHAATAAGPVDFVQDASADSQYGRLMRQQIYPSLAYEDAERAIEWLRAAFGIEAQLVVPGQEEGSCTRSFVPMRTRC
jgi:hypothetical protein